MRYFSTFQKKSGQSAQALHPQRAARGDDTSQMQAKTLDLPALILKAGTLARLITQGRHGTRRIGLGENFWQFRPHQPYEPANLIDWRQSARSVDETIRWVRERERETPRGLSLWVDPSASMRWSSQNNLQEKYAIALTAALTLGASALKGGERVSALGRGKSYQDMQKLPLLARELTQPPPSPSQEGTGHSPRFRLPPVALAPSHAQLLLVSDFLWQDEQSEYVLNLCRHRPGRCFLLIVEDPAEDALPYRGRIRFHNPEEHQEHDGVTLSSVEYLGQVYQARRQAHYARLRHFAGPRIQSLICRTDQPLLNPLLTLYRQFSA